MPKKLNILFLTLFTLAKAFYPHEIFAQVKTQATLVRVIDTSRWSPSSPDPAGIDFWPSMGGLLVSDSEVDEMPALFAGKNLYVSSAVGNLVNTMTTTLFSQEPTGIAINPANDHLFFSDDNLKKIFEVDAGADGIVGTTDDRIVSFSVGSYGIIDPEGLAFGGGFLFVADGLGTEVFKISQGANGKFEAPPPLGDDQVSHFDTLRLGQSDPEGIAYNPDKGNLYIVSRNAKEIIETTAQGNLVGKIDISALHAVGPAGLAFAPNSINSTLKSLFLTARGVDNNTNPNENDGKIYEIALGQFNQSNTPTLPASCPRKSYGDANCDSLISLSDFEIWRREFARELTSTNANFNSDSSVTLSDFEIWRRSFTS